MTGYEVTVPSELRDMIGRWERSGAEWIDTLPTLVPDIASAWGLDLGPALEPGGVLSWIAPAGEDTILKLSWPDDELKYEAEALLRWDPDIAVRVLRHDVSNLVAQRVYARAGWRPTGRRQTTLIGGEALLEYVLELRPGVRR